MPELSKESVALLAYLLPGFLAAWIFYGLTSHVKPTQFERTVQALIFTFLIQAFIPIVGWVLKAAGQRVALRPWDQTAEMLSSVVLAGVFGTLLAYCTNTDTVHRWLRRWGFTTRTSHPSEWFALFAQKVQYVILHLKDGRRLYGWPKEWPNEPGKGHFYVMLPSWIREDGSQLDLTQLDGLLIEANDVRWVEFLQKSEGVEDEKGHKSASTSS
jgi:hypothetical protein